MDNLMYLKSGTDIRGTAIPDENGAVDLTDTQIAHHQVFHLRLLPAPDAGSVLLPAHYHS